MGARGPQPKPTNQKQLEGTYRPDRAPANEPAADGKPICPSWLSQDAKTEWRRLVPDLIASGLAGRIDRNALARYVETWTRWRQAVQMIAKSGEVIPIKNEDGSLKYLQTSPYVSIARSLGDQLQKLEQSFGMTPSSRSRIDVGQTEAQDELDAFLNA